MPKLNKTTIESAKPPASGDAWLWDSELEGFGVRIQASGRKTYVARYRTLADKTQRKATIGRCSDLAPDKARELARKLFGKVADGHDPVAERRQVAEAEAPKLIADLAEAYGAKHAAVFKKASSAALDEKNWRLHILPRIGACAVRQATEESVLDVVAALKDKPAVANQCIALLSKAFALAEKWGWRDRHTNPCQDVKKFRLKQSELILSVAEIGRMDAVMTAMVQENEITQPMANLVRLLLLTGCRLREIMCARLAWVDRERCLLLLPDSKVGQRKIALSPAAMAIVEGMPADQEWLIPGRLIGEAMVTPYRPWARIKARAKLPAELRIHDLRHSFGSLAHASGMTQKQVATALGHAQLSTTERYMHGLKGDAAQVAATMGRLLSGAWVPVEDVATA